MRTGRLATQQQAAGSGEPGGTTDDIDGGTVDQVEARVDGRSRRQGGRPPWRHWGQTDSRNSVGSHLAHGVVGPERRGSHSGRDSRHSIGRDAILSGSQYRHFRALSDFHIVAWTAHNNTRNGGCHSSGNGGVPPLDKTTLTTTATAVAEVVVTSKAHGCSTDRSGTAAALLASCGACGVRDGSSPRPLSVLPRGVATRGETDGEWKLDPVSESRDIYQRPDLQPDASTVEPRPATRARNPPNSTAL